MITSTQLALAFLLTALFSVAELLRSRRDAEIESYIADREAQATHVLMNGGMAAMLAPLYSDRIGQGIVVVYGIAIAVLVVRLVRLVAGEDKAITNRVSGSIYHTLGLAAMIYAVHLMPATMPGMDGMMMDHAPGKPWLALALGAIFALDGLATAVLVGFFPQALIRMERVIDGEGSLLNPGDSKTLRAIRIAAIPHCIMDAGMALMLFA